MPPKKKAEAASSAPANPPPRRATRSVGFSPSGPHILPDTTRVRASRRKAAADQASVNQEQSADVAGPSMQTPPRNNTQNLSTDTYTSKRSSPHAHPSPPHSSEEESNDSQDDSQEDHSPEAPEDAPRASPRASPNNHIQLSVEPNHLPNNSSNDSPVDDDDDHDSSSPASPKEGPSTIFTYNVPQPRPNSSALSNVTVGQRSTVYESFKRIHVVENMLMRGDVLDAALALVNWAKRNNTQLPDPQQMDNMLDQFAVQQAEFSSTAPHANGPLDPGYTYYERARLQPVEEAAEQILDDEQMQNAAVARNEVVASEVHVGTPQIPIPETPRRQTARGYGVWQGLSAVKNLVATPFSFFGRRSQQEGAAATNIQSDSHTTPISETPSSAQTDMFTRTENIFRQADRPALPPQPKSVNKAVNNRSDFAPLAIFDPLDDPFTRAFRPKFPQRNSNEPRGSQTQPRGRRAQTSAYRPAPVMSVSRSERLRRQQAEATANNQNKKEEILSRRNVLSKEQILEIQMEQDRKKQRELNEKKDAADGEAGDSLMETSRLGDKRKGLHPAEVPAPKKLFFDDAQAESQRSLGRDKTRDARENELEIDDDVVPTSSQTGQKRKTPHKAKTPSRTPLSSNTFMVPSDSESSSDDEMEDKSPTLLRSKPRVTWAQPTVEDDVDEGHAGSSIASKRPIFPLKPSASGIFTPAGPRSKPGFNINPNLNIPKSEPPKASTATGEKKRPMWHGKDVRKMWLPRHQLEREEREEREAAAAAAAVADKEATPANEAAGKESDSTIPSAAIPAGLSQTSSTSTSLTQTSLTQTGSIPTGSTQTAPAQNDLTQTPPPKPRPANAQLPQATAALPPAAISAMAKAEAHKPKKPSGLREVSNMSPIPTPPHSEAKENQENKEKNIENADVPRVIQGPVEKVFSDAVQEAVNKTFDKTVYENMTFGYGKPQFTMSSAVEEEIAKLEKKQTWYV